MPVKLLKKTGDLYYGFHQKIGQTLYLVHPSGVEEAPKGVADIFAELSKEIDLSIFQPEPTTDQAEDEYLPGDEVFVDPTDELPAGFHTIIESVIFRVAHGSNRQAPQALIDVFKDYASKVDVSVYFGRTPSRQAQPVNTGEGSYIREEAVVTPTVQADPNALPPNWDQKPMINIPSLIAQPAQEDLIQDKNDGIPDAKIPTIVFTSEGSGGILAEQPLPTGGVKMDLDDGEQIVTG